MRAVYNRAARTLEYDARMDNRQVARVLLEIADLLEIKGENAFRVRSYRLAGETVEAAGQEVAEMVRKGADLKSLSGVGDGTAAKIKELVETGACAQHQALREEVPAGLLELLKIAGLGPKGVNAVWTKLGVTGPAELEAAIRDGRFRTLPGMKEKKEQKILKGLQDRAQAGKRFLLSETTAVADRLIAFLKAEGAEEVHPAGSFRRRRETAGDLDLIVVGGDATKLSDAFAKHPDVKEVLVHGAAKTSVVLDSGLQVDLRPFARESLGAALQYFTGSKTHNVAVRERAVRQGLKVNEYGVFRVETGEKLAGATEEEVYAAVGLAWVPPEIREDRGEVEAAEKRTLPKLLERADLRGDLHSHTVESDGRDTLEAMVEAARARGLQYYAITDHSRAIPSRVNRTGMDEPRALAHLARIRALHENAYIVALSGWGSDDDRRRTSEAGFNEHLTKPVKPADLRELMSRVFPG